MNLDQTALQRKTPPNKDWDPDFVLCGWDSMVGDGTQKDQLNPI